MRSRSLRIFATAATAAALLATIGAPSALAKGGAAGGGTAPTCAAVVVTNTGQTVRDFKQPDIKFNLENCSTTPANVTVTVSEAPSAWYPVCASPVAAPVQFALASRQKLSSTLPTFRGPCGFADNRSLVVINSTFAFQGHNLVLTVTDDATGAVLGVSNWFSWQDCLLCGGV